MPLSSTSIDNVAVAVADVNVGNEVTTLINRGDAIATQSLKTLALAIVATNVSQTIDFAALQVGDSVLSTPAGAGGAVNGYTVATVGTLPAAAVVGSTYLVFRATATALAAAVTTFKF